MSYIPAVPFGGQAGWAYLQRSRPVQQAAHDAAPAVARQVDDFSARIGKVTSAEALVADRRLLEVALGAFGLGDEIGSKFFIRKVLESNTRDPASLASKLTDKRYLALAESFGFGDLGGARTGDPGFARRITDAFRARGFEAAVGEQNTDMRLVMGLERELGQVTSRQSLSADGQWFTVMATPPLRQVFETALGLPKAIGALDLDRQLAEFRSRAEAQFGAGEVADFAAPEMREQLERRFLAMAELRGGTAPSYGGASAALAILQAGAGF